MVACRFASVTLAQAYHMPSHVKSPLLLQKQTFPFHLREPPFFLSANSRVKSPIKIQNASSRAAIKPLYLLGLFTNARPREKIYQIYIKLYNRIRRLLHTKSA